MVEPLLVGGVPKISTNGKKKKLLRVALLLFWHLVFMIT